MLANSKTKHLVIRTKNVFNNEPDFSWEFGNGNKDVKSEEDYNLLLKRNYIYKTWIYEICLKSPVNN